MNNEQKIEQLEERIKALEERLAAQEKAFGDYKKYASVYLAAARRTMPIGRGR